MQKLHKHRKILALVTAVVLASGALFAGLIFGRAFWDETKAVHIKSDDIESSTLIIGSHLIHLSSLNDSIYEVAQKSAEDSGQDRVYYKSEIGGDAWFDITTAASLTDITTGGSPVRDEEVEQLFFTHHTKSDRITYDLRTGEPVNIFDIRDPYDLERLEELDPLKMQYDKIIEMEDGSWITEDIDSRIWQTDVENPPGGVPAELQSIKDLLAGLGMSTSVVDQRIQQEQTNVREMSSVAVELKTRTEYEREISALQAYKNVLASNEGGAREIEKVDGVMAAVDASRRYLVYANLEISLGKYLDYLSRNMTTRGEEGTTFLKVDPELISAVAESLGNVQNAMIEHGGKMLSEGVSVMSSAEYEFSVGLIADAVGGSHAACDKDVSGLLLLDNIRNDIMSDRPAELELLESTLLPRATAEYTESLSQGESAEYLAEVANQSSQALLNRLIRDHGGVVNTHRGELEFLIEAKSMRMDTESAMDFIRERLDLTAGFTSGIPGDDFRDVCLESVDDHIDYLTEKFRELELALGGNEMDKLVAEKEALQTQRLSALDKNDLSGAKALEEKITAVEEKIRALEEENAAQIALLQDLINSLEDGSAEKTAAQAELENLQKSLSDGTLGAVVAQLKDDALEAFRDEDHGTVETSVNGLAGMLPIAPELVLPALQEVYNALVLNEGDESLIDSIEQAILENPNVLKDELGAAALRKLVDDYLAEQGVSGTSLNDPSEEAGGSTAGADGPGGLLGLGGISFRDARYGAIAAVGLYLYYEETGNPAALQVLASAAREQVSLGNPLVYERINDSTGEYIPLRAVQVLTGRRYVWEKNSSTGVLAEGADYYGFRVYSNQVQRDRLGEKTEEMDRFTKYLNDVHVPEEYIYEQFEIQSIYLADTTLGCACDKEMLTLAQELLALLMAA